MVENRALSDREREILHLLATGDSNKEISQKLFISENTTKVHLRNIFAKIGVSSRTEATLYAIREGLVHVDRPAEAAVGEPLPVTPVPQTRPRRIWEFALIGALAIVLFIALSLAASFRQPPQIASASPAPRVESRWKARAPMLSPRSNFGASVYENKIYIIGGESEGKVLATVDRYDPGTDTWEQLSPKPTAVADINAVFVGGRIFAPGGRLVSGSVTNVLEAYDPRADQWETRAALPVALSAYALATFEGKIYLFGGWDGERYVASTYEYDPSSDAWQVRTAMPTPRGFAGASISGGRILVLGGYDGTNILAVNEQYSPDRDDGSANPWVSRQPLPQARYGMGAASVADFVYVIGGEGVPNTILPPLEYLPQDKWQQMEIPVQKIGSQLVVVPVQGLLFGMGGKVGGTATAQNVSYQAIYTIFLPFGQ